MSSTIFHFFLLFYVSFLMKISPAILNPVRMAGDIRLLFHGVLGLFRLRGAGKTPEESHRLAPGPVVVRPKGRLSRSGGDPPGGGTQDGQIIVAVLSHVLKQAEGAEGLLIGLGSGLRLGACKAADHRFRPVQGIERPIDLTVRIQDQDAFQLLASLEGNVVDPTDPRRDQHVSELRTAEEHAL